MTVELLPTPTPHSAAPPPRSARLAPQLALAALVLAALCVAVGPAAASIGHAQPRTDPTVRARELYQEGRRLGEQGRWEEARAAFEQALALRDAPLLHFALGTAQAETGRLVAARASLRRFVASATDAASLQQVPAAEAALRALEPRLAHLTVRFDGGTPASVRLDGEELPLAALGSARDVDPGSHRVELVPATGAEAIVRDVVLREGAREEVVIAAPQVLPRTGPASPGRPSRPARQGSGGVLTRWWFWTAVGVVVVGATVGVVVATQSGARDPFEGDAPGGALETLRFHGP